MPLSDEATRMLTDASDPGAAGPMAEYMKTDMPFHGVRSPQRRTILNALLARYPTPDNGAYRR